MMLSGYWTFVRSGESRYEWKKGRPVRKGMPQMQPKNVTKAIPVWLDRSTRKLIEDIIGELSERHPDLVAVILYGSVARHKERPLDEPNPSDVDLLAVLDSDDPHVALHQGDALFHTLGLAYNRHLDTPREVQVLFASRTLQEWDPTFIANVARDGIVLFTRGPLPIPFAA
jgi:predicted nucleotidyltransferase